MLKKHNVFGEQYMRKTSAVWRRHKAAGFWPLEGLQLREPIAGVAGKKNLTSLSISSVNELEVHRE